MSEYRNNEFLTEELQNDITENIKFMSAIVLNVPLFKNTLQRIEQAIKYGEKNGINTVNEKTKFEQTLHELLPHTIMHIVTELSKYLDGGKTNKLVTQSNGYTPDDWLETAQELINEAHKRGCNITAPEARYMVLKKALYSIPNDETETIEK